MGTIHGGIAMTLLDSAAGAAVHTTSSRAAPTRRSRPRPISSAPLPPMVREPRAEGTVVHRGSTVATSEARLVDGEGKLYAHATSTCLILGD